MIKQSDEELEKGIKLPFMEEFYTIQGEGYFTGSSAYFLRIGGCDIGCHWCDIKESWNPKLYPARYVDDIIDKIMDYPTKTVVVTGGEPLMWNMNYLTKKLRYNNLKVHLETSGAYDLTGDFDWICLSPKKNQSPLEIIKSSAHELKIIIYNKNDFRFAEQQRLGVSPLCKLYLQPEWSRKEEVIPLITDYILKNPNWEISIQTHKYLNMP